MFYGFCGLWGLCEPYNLAMKDMISALVVCSFDGPRLRYTMQKKVCAGR